MSSNEPIPNPSTIAEALAWGKDALEGGESPAIDARVLLCHCMDANATYLMTWPEKVVPQAALTRFIELIQRRTSGVPVAHLTGYRDFWTLKLAVTADTLIPRPDTEILVETALSFDLPNNARVLDLGTGTGAIALALASERPDWQVTGVDKQLNAVELAKANAVSNELSHVHFLHSDWFSALADETFDLIVSNPPYVEDDSPYLKEGDVRFEPDSALTSGKDGLNDIRIIMAEFKKHLAPGGYILFEHGFEQDKAVRQIMSEHSLSNVNTVEDLSQLPRCTFGRDSN